MNWKKIPKKGWVSLASFIISLALFPVALSTGYTFVIILEGVFSGFGWGILYALPSNPNKETKEENAHA